MQSLFLLLRITLKGSHFITDNETTASQGSLERPRSLSCTYITNITYKAMCGQTVRTAPNLILACLLNPLSIFKKKEKLLGPV